MSCDGLLLCALCRQRVRARREATRHGSDGPLVHGAAARCRPRRRSGAGHACGRPTSAFAASTLRRTCRSPPGPWRRRRARSRSPAVGGKVGLDGLTRRSGSVVARQSSLQRHQHFLAGGTGREVNHPVTHVGLDGPPVSSGPLADHLVGVLRDLAYLDRRHSATVAPERRSRRVSRRTAYRRGGPPGRGGILEE